MGSVRGWAEKLISLKNARRIAMAAFLFYCPGPSAQIIPFGFFVPSASPGVDVGSGATGHPFMDQNGANFVNAFSVTMPAAVEGYLGFSPSSCTIYIGAVGAGGNLQCGVYSAAGAFLCSSSSQAAVANSYNTIPLSGCPGLEPGETYGLGWNNTNNSIQYGENGPGSLCSSPSGSGYYWSETFGNWTDPAPGGTAMQCLYDTKLTVVPSGTLTTAIDKWDDREVTNSGEYNDGEISGINSTTGGEFYPGGTAWLTGDMGQNNPDQRMYGYFRFLVAGGIPAGSTVNSATINFESYGSAGWAGGTDALRIWVQRSADSPMPLASNYYPGDSAGTVLSAVGVRWPAAGGLAWPAAPTRTTSTNFAAALQEVVDAYGGIPPGGHFTVWVAIDSISGTSQRLVTFIESTAGADRSVRLALSVTPPNLNVTPTKIKVSGPSSLFTRYCSESAFSVQLQDVANKSAKATSSVQVNLTSSGSGTFYSDSSCTASITSVTIPAGSYIKTFYYKSNVSESVTITGTDNASSLTTGTLNPVATAVRAHTWIGSGGNALYSNPANWSTNDVPDGYYTEAVYFDGNCVVCNVTIDQNIWPASFNMISGFTGTISQGTSGISFGAGTPGVAFRQEAGTFNGGSGNSTFNGWFVKTGGVFSESSGSTTVGNDFTHTGGTITANGGTWYIDGADIVDFGLSTMTIGNLVFSSGWSVAFTGTVVVNGNVTLQSGGSLHGGTVSFKGNLTATNQINVEDDATLFKFIGTGAQTWSGTSDTGKVEIASSGTVTISGTVKLSSNFTYTTGTVVTTGSTVDFTGGYGVEQVITPGSIGFNHVKITHGGDADISVVGTMNVGGDLTLNMAPIGSYGALDGGTISVAGNVVGTHWGNSAIWPGSTRGSTAFTFIGSANQTISRSAGNLPSGAFTINKAGGSLSFSNNMPFNSGQAIDVTAGTLDLNSRNLTGSPNVTLAAGTTLRLHGSQTVTVGSVTPNATSTVEYYGTTNNSGFNLRMGTTYGHLIFNGVGGQWRHGATTVNGDLTITNGSLSANGALTVAGNWSNSGTYIANAQTLNLAGNWSNPGTFTYGTGLVNLNGTNQSISTSNTFYRLTKSVTTARTLTFTAGTTTNVTNTMTLQGAVGQLLSLHSSSAGSQWSINPSGTRTVGYVDVKDSNNTNGTAISGGGTSVNSGNNTNWTLP